MNLIKKLLITISVILLLLVVAAIATPYFFKPQIIEIVKAETNDRIDATLDFSDVNLSLIRNFPNFSLSLENLKITGKNQFEGIELISAEEINLGLDLMSVIKNEKPIKINNIHLEKPNMHIIVLKDGTANYDIYASDSESDTPTEENGAMEINLKKYGIHLGNIIYDDKQGGNYVKLKDLTHTGKGDFTSDIFNLVTQTSIQSFTAKSGGITYLKKANTKLDATFEINMPKAKYTFKENELSINDLKANFDGFVQLLDDGMNLDLTFDTPNNKFKSIFSLIPGAYIDGYKDVIANGDMNLSGKVKGKMIGESYPAFNLDFNVNNADVKYPELPLGIKNIQSNISIKSPSSNLDNMVINISKFNMNLNNRPFQMNLLLKHPMTDPDIKTEMIGSINLADVSKAFPMEGVQNLSGIIDSDVRVETKLSTIENANYEQVKSDGNLKIQNVNYIAEGMPRVVVNSLVAKFSPQNILIDNFDLILGKSDLKGSFQLDNFLAYFSPDKTMKGKLFFNSNYFDVDEWMGDESDTQTTSTNTTGQEAEIFDRFDFETEGYIKKMKYDTYTLLNNEFEGRFTSSTAEFKKIKTKIGQSDFHISGKLNPLFGYLFDNETLRGDIHLKSHFLDMNQFMVEETNSTGAKAIQTAQTEEIIPFEVPENLNLNLTADIDKVRYTDMDLSKLKGGIIIKDKKATLKNTAANFLGGKILLDGGYDSNDPKSPGFNVDFGLKNMDFKKAFEKFNTFQKLAPIAKYMTGNFNTSLNMNGKLGQDMMPDLSSLNIEGFLETIDAFLSGFKPLEKVGNLLNVSELKNPKVKDIKTWFTLKDGTIQVKEFPVKIAGMDLKIKGQHSLVDEMKYEIRTRIPKSKLGKAAKYADKGLGLLQSQASKLGINLNSGSHINVLATITGSHTAPKVSIKPLGADGKEVNAKSVVENVKEQVKEQVKEKVEVVKKDYKAKADAEVKKIMDKARSQAKKVKAEAKKQADNAKQLSYKEAVKLVEKAGSNPLKKIGAQQAAKLAKKQADKVHKKALEKANQKADDIVRRAEKQADKVRAKYEKM